MIHPLWRRRKTKTTIREKPNRSDSRSETHKLNWVPRHKSDLQTVRRAVFQSRSRHWRQRIGAFRNHSFVRWSFGPVLWKRVWTWFGFQFSQGLWDSGRTYFGRGDHWDFKTCHFVQLESYWTTELTLNIKKFHNQVWFFWTQNPIATSQDPE